MKLVTHVYSAEDVGDHLEIKAQGLADSDGKFGPSRTAVIRLPVNSKTKRAFYVGRRVNITIEPA